MTAASYRFPVGNRYTPVARFVVIPPRRGGTRSERPCAVHHDHQGVERRRSAHEETVSLRTTEADIGDHFGRVNLAEKRTVRVVDMDSVAGRGPDPTVLVAPDTVEESGRSFRENAAIREFPVLVGIEDPDVAWSVPDVRRSGIRHVQAAFVR